MRAQSVIDYSVYLLVRFVICLIQSLPLNTCQQLSNQFGILCWHVLRLRRKVIEENLRTAFPHLSQGQRDRIALGMWQHLLLMVAEIAHAPRKLHRTNWRKHSGCSRMKDMLARLIDERPLVIICGHLGNFELGGYLVALHGFPTHTVARPLDNPYLNRFVNDFRGRTGQHMLDKDGSGEEISELLNSGGTLGLLGDQDAGARGCWVDFFGKPAPTHKAVGVFTLGSQAPTIVCAAIRKAPMKFEMQISDIVDPLEEGFQLDTIPMVIEWYTRCLEELIRKAPQQYWWVHRRWKRIPVSRKDLRKKKQAKKAA